MEKLTLQELRNRKDWTEAVIVFTKESFDHDYTVEERSYKVNRDAKYFNPHAHGNSLFGDCLDGKDDNVRLDWYMHVDEGEPWIVEYCYILK